MTESYITHDNGYFISLDEGTTSHYYLVTIDKKMYVRYVNKPFDIKIAQRINQPKHTIEGFIHQGVWKRFTTLREVKAYAMQKELDKSLSLSK